MNAKEFNLTVGKPASVILRFAIPILMTNLLQNLYTTIDTIIVGRFVGKQALAGVGSTGAINFLIIGFCMGLCSGFVIPVAQSFGANDYKRLRSMIANCFWVGIVMAFAIAITVCTFSTQILTLMKTPESIFDYAHSYIFIIFAGIPITIAYNLLAGILRSVGDSKTPMVFLMMGSVINIGFDLFSVLVLHLGVRGPALATILSQLFSAVMCFYVLKTRYTLLKFEEDEWQFRPSHAAILCGMGVPMGLQYSITAIGSVLLQTGINTLGADPVAAVAAAGRLNLFIGCPYDALGSSMATFAGQNVGAKKIDRIREGLFASVKIGLCYYIVTFIIMLFAAPYLIMLFVKPTETTVIALASLFIKINVGFMPLLICINTFRYTIQGMGYSTFAISAGVFEMVARTLVGVWLIPVFGFLSSCFANPLAWLFGDFFLIPAFFFCLKRTKQRLAVD